MSIKDQLAEPGPSGEQHIATRKNKYPEGWQPRSDIDDQEGGYIVSQPSEATTPASHTEILSTFGYDPEEWVVVSSRSSRWEKANGDLAVSQRINVLPKSSVPVQVGAAEDMEEILERMANWRPDTNAPTRRTGGGSFVAPIGDQQIGKSEGGGTEGTIERSLLEYQRGFLRFKKLDSEIGFGEVVIPQLGDCIEGFNSQGGAHVMRTDLGLTSMVRVYRRLLQKQIEMYIGHVDKIKVPVVPGNHDEAHRINNKMATTSTDSWAVDAASALLDAFSMNPELDGRIEFFFPEEDHLTITIESSGTVIGMAHGHQFGAKPLDWWNRQSGLRSNIGDADILLSGHLHHLHVQDHSGGRTFLQVPALDGGSNWFKHTKGSDSPSRAVTFWTKDGYFHDLDPIGR